MRSASTQLFHQPYLEGSLRDGVARFPCVEVRTGLEVTSIDEAAGGVEVTAQGLDNRETLEVRGSYVLACDGGSSTIRKRLGVPFSGSSYDEQWLDVQARVKRPMSAGPHFRFICDPERPGVDCPCPAGYHRWEWRINKGEDAEEMQSPERIWGLLAARGVTADDIEIQRHWTYTFHVRCAERWRVGRVLLVGDAAHVMPPFAGQGISGAFRDAANLCWKLAAVIEGRADDALLDSYELERRAQHDEVLKATIRIGRLVMPPNRVVARLRDVILGALTRIPAVTNKISREAIRPAPLKSGYLGGQGGRRSVVGRLIPLRSVFVEGRGRIDLDEALGDRFAVLGLSVDPRTAMDTKVTQAWQAASARFLTIRAGTSVVGPDEIGDAQGESCGTGSNPTGRRSSWCARTATSTPPRRGRRFQRLAS